jgi:chemotaxis protein MotB
LLLAAGCVPEAQYKEALAASRRANEQLTECKNALRELRAENQRLLSQLEGREGALGSREQAFAQLQANYDKLQADFKELYDKYQKAVESGPEPMPVGMAILPAQLDKALRDFARENPDLVEYLPKYGMVKLKSDLTFAPGSVAVKRSTGDALRRFVNIMQQPGAQRFHVYIAGHTDNIPIEKPSTKQKHPDNWYLSVHRAVAVQKIMTSGGLTPERMGVMGFSKYHPIEPNKPNQKGNEANRRVEIWIVPPDRFLTAAQE